MSLLLLLDSRLHKFGQHAKPIFASGVVYIEVFAEGAMHIEASDSGVIYTEATDTGALHVEASDSGALVDDASASGVLYDEISGSTGMSLTIYRGFDLLLHYRIDKPKGVPLDISGYEEVWVDFETRDPASGSVDILNLQCTVLDDGVTEALRGKVDVAIPRADTKPWNQSVEVLYQFRALTSGGLWHPVGGPSRATIGRRIADTDLF